MQILLLSRISVGSLSLCSRVFDLLIFFQWWTITAQQREVHLSALVTVLSPACLETNTKSKCILELVVVLSQLGIWFPRGKWHNCYLVNFPILNKIYLVKSQHLFIHKKWEYLDLYNTNKGALGNCWSWFWKQEGLCFFCSWCNRVNSGWAKRLESHIWNNF